MNKNVEALVGELTDVMERLANQGHYVGIDQESQLFIVLNQELEARYKIWYDPEEEHAKWGPVE